MGLSNPDTLISPIELQGNFLLRQSTLSDLSQLSDFNSKIHSFVPDHEVTIPAMTKDLLEGTCPSVESDSFTLVIDNASKKIVSAMALIPQTWSYGGIDFKVGRPELVGTDPEFRGKGFIREQFKVLHQRSKNLGHLAQAISGIPLFYRQFGYEFAIPAGGGRFGSISRLKNNPVSSTNELVIRDARLEDLAWIEKCYQSDCTNYLVTCKRDLENWQYELVSKSQNHIHKMEIRVISLQNNSPVGFFVCHKPFSQTTEKTAVLYGILPKYSWWKITPFVLDFLTTQGKKDAELLGGTLDVIGLELGENHPSYSVCGDVLTKKIDPGAWYFRIDDMVSFIHLISPVLQKRIHDSGFSGYQGELRMSLNGRGISLIVKNGVIENVASYSLKTWEDADAAFPNLTFHQMLLGFRTLGDIQYAYPDCWCHEETADLVKILFPQSPSNVLGIA